MIQPQTDSPPPLVVKIGGGLLRDEGLEGLRRACVEAVELARSRPVLIVPGGGPFADAVRAVDAQSRLADPIAHTLALRAMDQLGVLLRQLLPAAELLADLVRPRTLALLQAEAAFTGRPGVPESWAVTSDSLAVLAAGAIAAPEAILLKSVAGVLPQWPSHRLPVPELSASELQDLQDAGGGRAVDRYLPEAVRRTGVTVTIRKPGAERPAHATILAESPSGTRITPS